MTTLLTTMSVMFLMKILNVSNPLKMSLILLGLSGLLFLILSVSANSIWLPAIFFILFMGGVLILFMLISSILPNEPMKKKSKISIMTILMLCTLMWASKSYYHTSTSISLKTVLDSSNNMIWVIIIISLYFTILLFNLCKSSNPLRTYLCHWKKLIL